MRLILLATALSAALIAYSLFWFRTAAEIPRELEALADDLRAQGWGVSYQEPVVRGFPFRLEVEVPKLMLARPRPGQGFAWQGSRVTIFLQPWQRSHIVASSTGTQRLILDGASWSGTVDQTVASLRVANGGVSRASLDLTGVRLRGPDGASMEIGRLQLHVRRYQDSETADGPPQTDIYLQADEVMLPGEPGAPLTRRLTRFSLGLNHPTIAEGSLVWIEQGGPLEVAQLILDWPPLAANGQGRLALDANGRPSGELEVTIAGTPALIEALARAGRLSALEATLAQTAFAVLAASQGSGGGLKVAATLSNGGFYLGPVRLGGLPTLK